MSRIFSAFLILAVLAMGIPLSSANAQTPEPTACPYLFPPDPTAPLALFVDPDPTGSNYCVWVPPDWDGQKMVIFAHGYVDPLRPDGTIPTDQLIIVDPTTGEITSLPQIILGMGYAFGVPSYSKNGLAVKEGVQDVEALAARFKANGVREIYLVGASEGGLVTALAIEHNPLVPTPSAAQARTFTAGVSTCGPVGDFKRQVNYWGDFRVAFDYFFNQYGGFLQGDAITIDPATIAAWGTYNPLNIIPGSPEEQILMAMATAPAAQTKQLLSVGKAPIDPNVPATIGMTVLGILDYNVKATNEAQVELKGNPFDNHSRWYFGSTNDWLLNKWIRANDTYSASGEALTQIAAYYQTSGKLRAPLVTLHTTGDPIVPYWHEPLYMLKVWLSGNGLKLFSIPIPRYGHCAFTAKEALFAFALAVFRATGTIPAFPITSLADNQVILTQQEFERMLNMVDDDPPNVVFIPAIRK